MSLTSTQTLDDASGDDVVYNMLFQGPAETRRIDVASTAAEPGYLVIKHSASGKNGDAIDRHLVQFSRTKLSSTGVPRVCTANFTLSIPRDTVITATIVEDLVANLVDLISDGGFSGSGFAGVTNLVALMRGES